MITTTPVTNTEKQVVQYVQDDSTNFIELGLPAYVDVIGHPDLGTCSARTSRVIRIEPNTGVFETLNTVYKPVQQING